MLSEISARPKEGVQKPDLTQRMIGDVSFVEMKSFQEYVFKAERIAGGLKSNDGYKYDSTEDNPRDEIRQIRLIIAQHGNPKEKDWDEDKFGRLYVASYPLKDGLKSKNQNRNHQ